MRARRSWLRHQTARSTMCYTSACRCWQRSTASGSYFRFSPKADRSSPPSAR
jgi:hypothetical protein